MSSHLLLVIQVVVIGLSLNSALGQGSVPSDDNYDHEISNVTNSKPSPLQIWGIGLGFVTIISLASCAGIALMPLLSEQIYNKVLTYCVGLGVGSLCGSAAFHLIPHTFHLGAEGTKVYLQKCWAIVGGICFFFLADKALKIYMVHRKNVTKQSKVAPVQNKGLSGVNSVSTTTPTSLSGSSVSIVNREEYSYSNGDHKTTVNVVYPNIHDAPIHVDPEIEKQAHAMCLHDEHDMHYIPGESIIKTVAWMILFGDGLHNFVDGLSIGAAFTSSINYGISISLAILCEEFPHELGDVAILLNSGMSLKQALVFNLLSASTCYVGFIIGVLLGALENVSVFIFAFASGMFLYIALGSMVPEMNEVMDKKLKKGPGLGPALRMMAVQTAGVSTGLIALFLLAYFGDAISF